MLHECGQLLFGSRNVTFTEDGEYNEGTIPKEPDEIEQDMFVDAVEYIHSHISVDKLADLEEEFESKLVLFGENMVKHSLEYEWDDVPQWLMFGVYHVEDEQYLPFDDVQQIADRLGFETVPKVDELQGDKFQEQFDPENPDKVVPDSEYREGTAEGIVLHNQDNGAVRWQTIGRHGWSTGCDTLRSDSPTTRCDSDTDERVVQTNVQYLSILAGCRTSLKPKWLHKTRRGTESNMTT